MPRLAAVLLCVTAGALGAESFDEFHGRLFAENPEGVTLTISVARPEYRTGERIEVTLTVENKSEAIYYWRGSDHRRSHFDFSFQVDGPESGWADPKATLMWRGVGNGQSRREKLGSFTFRVDLNERARFDRAGEYRVFYSALDLRSGPGYRDPAHRITSPIMKLRIVPASEEWLEAELRAAQKELAATDRWRRRPAVRRVGYLGTPAAARTLVPLLGDQFVRQSAWQGIVGCRDWKSAREALEEGLADPDQVVDIYYVGLLAHLSHPKGYYLAGWDPRDPSATAGGHRGWYDRARADGKAAARRLAKHIGAKRGKALDEAYRTLIENDVHAPGLREWAVKNFESLWMPGQASYLDYHWEVMRCDGFKPILKRILFPTKASAERDKSMLLHLRSAALLRYMEFRPEKVRSIILREIALPSPAYRADVLSALPDASLPELDEVLVNNLAADGADLTKVAMLVERYASAAVAGRVKALYARHEAAEAGAKLYPLVGYLLKHVPKAGLAAAERGVTLLGREWAMLEVLKRHWGPGAADLAVKLLAHPGTSVAATGARALGEKGLAEHFVPLLERLGGLDPAKTVKAPGEAYSEAELRREIIGAVLDGSDRLLTEARLGRLKGAMTEEEVRRFANSLNWALER